MDAYEPTAFMPPAYDLVWSLALLTHLVLVIVALWHFFRDRPQGLFAPVGALLIVFVPLLGPAIYLLARRGEAALQRQQDRQRQQDQELSQPEALSPGRR